MVKGTRKLSAYNVFMKEELKRVKKSNPKIGHQDAFKMVAKNWKNHSGKVNVKSSNNVTKKVKRKKYHKKK